MSVRFIVGRSGTGKSERCLAEIRGKLRERPDGPPLVLLVPEQATFQADYALLSEPYTGAALRAQSLSFRRLAFRVMQETGGAADAYIDETGKQMLLFKAAHQRKDELKLYRSAHRQPAVIAKLNDLITELKRYRIDADTLTRTATEAAGALKDKLDDVALLYRELERELEGKYVDSEDYISRLAANVESSRFLREAEVWVDGFHGFTPQELDVMEQLFCTCRRVTVALCVDRVYEAGERPDELELFHKTALTMSELQERVDKAGVVREEPVLLERNVRHAGNPVLAAIERGYGNFRAARWEGGNPSAGLAVRSALNRRIEIESVARDLLLYCREHGGRYLDVVVLARNLDAYSDYIKAVFRDYGIPFFLDEKRNVLHHPLVEFIRSATETVLFGWKYDALFRCVKTELLLPLAAAENEERLAEARRAADELERYVLAFGLEGYRWTDGKPWRYVPSHSSLSDRTEQDEERYRELLDTVNGMRAAVAEPLARYEASLKRARTVRDMAEALYALLEETNAPQRMQLWAAVCEREGHVEKAREHAQMWDRIVDMLDQLVETAGDEELPQDRYAGMLDTGLEGIRLGLVPPSLDGVLVGSLERSRPPRVKRLYVIGVTDGVLPSRGGEGGGILSEPERDELEGRGVAIAPGARRKLLDEQFLIYQALSAAEDKLCLSWPLADEEGKSLLPSEVIRRVTGLISGVQIELLTGEPTTDREAADMLVHPGAALSMLLVRLRAWRSGEQPEPLWRAVYNWFAVHPEWSERLREGLRALFYRNAEESLTEETALSLYGDRLVTSVSRLERYASCPFAYFAAYGLKLEERRLYRLQTPDIGQLYHAALHEAVAGMLAAGLDMREASREECAASAEAAVDRLMPLLLNELLLSSRRNGFIAGKLRDVVSRTTAVLSEQARYGDFVPVGLELQFGRSGSLPQLVLPLPGGKTMLLEGRIDRVDAAEGQGGLYVRIMDYKSSGRSFSPSEVYHGLALQLLAYLDAAAEHAEAWLGRAAKPAGVLYFHVHDPIITSRSPITADEANAQRFKSYKMKGLVLGEREALRLMDGKLESGYSDILPVRLKKDGSFASGSSVATERQWEHVRSFVRTKMRQLGDRLLSGEVGIEPYRLQGRTACDHCSYRPVCQFDRLLPGNDYRKLSPVTRDELLGTGGVEE